MHISSPRPSFLTLLLTSRFILSSCAEAPSFEPHLIPRAENLQTFTDALGGFQAAAITYSGDDSRPYMVDGDTFPDFYSASQRSCNDQFNSCQAAANAGGASFTVGDCTTQETNCQSAESKVKVTTFGQAASTSTSTSSSKTSTKDQETTKTSTVKNTPAPQAASSTSTSAAPASSSSSSSSSSTSTSTSTSTSASPTPTTSTTPAAATTGAVATSALLPSIPDGFEIQCDDGTIFERQPPPPPPPAAPSSSPSSGGQDQTGQNGGDNSD